MNDKAEATEDTRGTITVGVDGSEGSREALQWAENEAAARGDRLHVVQVWQPPIGSWLGPAGVAELSSWGSVNWGKEFLTELKRTIASALPNPRVDIRASVIEGNAAQRLIDVAEKDDAEMVVVGSRGLGGFSKLLLGSVSEQVATHATCPVVVIRSIDLRDSKKAKKAAAKASESESVEKESASATTTP